MRIVLLGKPGSGKGTQAAMLSEESGLPHLSSGAILRDEIREKTPFGMQIEEYVLRGEIGPQELITDVVFGYIERNGYASGFILDGFAGLLALDEEACRPYDRTREGLSLGDGAAISLYLLPILVVVSVAMLWFARRAEVT